MDLNAQITPWVMENISYIMLAVALLMVIALMVFISINLKLAKLNRRYKKMMEGVEDGNLESAILQHIEAVRQAGQTASRLEQECRRLDERLQGCVQRVGTVRFSAFEGTGSDLSFAIALLDAKNNGVVISSIFGRNESRIYAKPVEDGQSSYFLTNEEKKALAEAKEKSSKS